MFTQRHRVSPESGAAGGDDYVPYIPVKERKKAEVGAVYCVWGIYHANLDSHLL